MIFAGGQVVGDGSQGLAAVVPEDGREVAVGDVAVRSAEGLEPPSAAATSAPREGDADAGDAGGGPGPGRWRGSCESR